MALHSNLDTADGIHIPYAWVYASSTTREGASGFVAGDVGKFARQTDDNSLWMLVATTPTWVEVGNSGGSISATLLSLICRKGSSGTIDKGSPVYVTGYNVGGWVEVEPAKADSPSTMPSVGIARGDLTNASDGEAVVAGTVPDVDTSAFSEGDELFVSAATAGLLTETRPTGATDLIQKVAKIIRDDAVEGVVQISGAGRVNAMPNLTSGKVWQGDGSNHAAEVTPLATSATAPVNVTKSTAAAGAASDASRQDHKHDVTTAVPVAVGAALAEGTSASLARADHVHERLRGSQQQDAASEGESSTSSTSYVQKLRLTTPSLPAGRYRIGWNYEWQYDSAANDALVQVEVDDATVVMEMRQEPADAGSDQWNNKAGFVYVDLTAAAHTVDIDYRSASGIYSTHVRRARVEIWRVS